MFAAADVSSCFGSSHPLCEGLGTHYVLLLRLMLGLKVDRRTINIWIHQLAIFNLFQTTVWGIEQKRSGSAKEEDVRRLQVDPANVLVRFEGKSCREQVSVQCYNAVWTELGFYLRLNLFQCTDAENPGRLCALSNVGPYCVPWGLDPCASLLPAH